MGKINATETYFTMNSESLEMKADQLGDMVSDIANIMMRIDDQIKSLTSAGLTGSSIQVAADTYIQNRTVISNFVQRFGSVALVIEATAQKQAEADAKAKTAAAGVTK